MSESDPKELSISFDLSKAGLPTGKLSFGTNSRAFVALDRLVGNGIETLGSGLAKRRARDAAELNLIEEEGKAALAKCYANPEFGARVAHNFLKGEARKVVNREAIAEKFVEHMQEGDDPGAPEGELDEDWLNVFEAAAEKATSDRLRDMWGRVLAGEVRKPGSFCLSTLRLISGLDATIAGTFQKHISKRISRNELPQPSDVGGVLLEEFCFLEAVGLIQGSTGRIFKTIKRQDDGYYLLWSGDYVLKMKVRQVGDLTLPLMYVTRVGQELASILPPPEPIEALSDVAASFDKNSEEAIILLAGEQVSPTQRRSKIVKTIKSLD